MALLPIRTYPDPVLAERAQEVETIDEGIRRLVRDMAETMYAAPGVGLAANQVGVLRRVLVIDVGDPEVHKGLIAVINPEIVRQEGRVTGEEGCLSIPEIREEVERWETVVVRGLDPEGNPVEIEAKGLLAVAFQHEIDHLDGILFWDRLSSLKRSLAKRRYRKEREEREKSAAGASA